MTFSTELDSTQTLTYTFKEKGTSLLSKLGAEPIEIDVNYSSLVIIIPEMTGIAVGTYDFSIVAQSSSDITTYAQYTLHIEVVEVVTADPDPCSSA